MKVAADPSPQAEQGKFPWERLGFLQVVAALAIACSSQSPEPVDAGAADSDAGATADSTVPTGADADAQAEVASDPGPTGPEAECLTMALPCWKFSWVNGNCVQAPINGPNCEEVPTPCDTPPGSACARTSSNPCLESSGTCSADGVCVAKSLPAGTTCKVAAPKTCQGTIGKCDAAAKCVADAAVGAPCKVIAPEICDIASGICDATGKCVAKHQPAGTACTYLPADACHTAKGTCSTSGTCVTSVLVGAACAAAPGACGGGTCDATGACVLSATGKICGSKACQVGTCNAAAKCEFSPIAVGTLCAVANPPQCRSAQGSCSASGSCQLSVTPGAACALGTGPCGAGICQADGSCKATAVGQACMATAGPCQVALCSGAGTCEVVDMPAGSNCPLAEPGPCQASTGSCSAAAQCQPLPKPAGSSCTIAKPGPCQKSTGVCSAAGQCLADADAGAACSLGGQGCSSGTCGSDGTCQLSTWSSAGTSCGSDVGCGVPTCDGQGACVASPAFTGQACGGTSPFACSKRVCTAAGQCVLAPTPGAACFALADFQQASCSAANQCSAGVCGGEIGKCELKPQTGKACKATGECTIGVCSAAGSCEQVPVAVGKSCASTSPCTVGICSAAGQCEQVPVADGKSCPLGPNSDPQCASGTCFAGECAAVPKTGESCGYQLCKAGVCSDKGVCEFTPTPGKLCGAESECASMVCAVTGECKSVIKTGASCGSGPCQAGTCSADGKCIQQVKVGASCQDPDLCGDGVCNAQGQCVSSAFPKKSECHVSTSSVLGECWAGVAGPSGNCTKVARVGAACGCWVSPCSMGTCQADGSCLQKPSKPAGTPCSGECVKNGVCTSAGKCSGSVAVGLLCNDGEDFRASYGCRSPRCQADGDCAPVFQPAGTSCADAIAWVQPAAQWECGQLDKCDGQGHCIAKNPAKDGTSCSLGDPCSPGRTCFAGHCLSTDSKSDQTPCKFGCVAGVCNSGWCEKTSLASDVSCDDGNLCTQDACCGVGSHASPVCSYYKPGQCAHNIDAGKVCFDSGCTLSVCDAYTGKCATKTFVSGKPCGTNTCGDKLVCIMLDCIPASGAISCQDYNPCTVDACDGCGCSHSPSPYLEGKVCAQGGHCLKGNCVPD